MKKYIIAIAVVFLCFISCKKENSNVVTYYSDTLLSQVSSGSQTVHGLTYNSSYLIYESMEPYTYNKYTYDSQNTLRKVELAFSLSPLSCVYIPGASVGGDPRNAPISQYLEFEYNDALKLLKKSDYYVNGGKPKLISYQTYDYVNDNIVKISSFNAQEQMTQYNNYTYDENGNVTRDDLYISGTVAKLLSTMVYEFDDKNNPYRVFSSQGEPGKYTNRNNIVKETHISYNGTVESSNTTLHTYEYNSLNYPVKIDKLECKYGK